MSEPNEILMQRAAALQAQGEEFYGKANWGAMIDSVGRAGVAGEHIQRIVADADALPAFASLGMEAILREMQASDNPNDAHARALDESYRAIRQIQKGARGRRR